MSILLLILTILIVVVLILIARIAPLKDSLFTTLKRYTQADYNDMIERKKMAYLNLSFLSGYKAPLPSISEVKPSRQSIVMNNFKSFTPMYESCCQLAGLAINARGEIFVLDAYTNLIRQTGDGLFVADTEARKSLPNLPRNVKTFCIVGTTFACVTHSDQQSVSIGNDIVSPILKTTYKWSIRSVAANNDTIYMLSEPMTEKSNITYNNDTTTLQVQKDQQILITYRNKVNNVIVVSQNYRSIAWSKDENILVGYDSILRNVMNPSINWPNTQYDNCSVITFDPTTNRLYGIDSSLGLLLFGIY